jgi:ubiquitin conjugation factor E4 B
VLKQVWHNDAKYRRKIKEASCVEHEFIPFVNMLINNTTYLLDESLTKLASIHTLQQQVGSSEFASLPVSQRQEKQSTLSQYEKQWSLYMSLANETVHMLAYLSTAIVDPFLRPEIIDRLAAMPNHNLKQLVLSKRTNLKVRASFCVIET